MKHSAQSKKISGGQRQRMKNRYIDRVYGGFVIMDSRGIFYSAKRSNKK